MPAQRRADVAHRSPGAGLQDHCRLPERQRPRHPKRVQPVRARMPQAQAAQRGRGGRGRQQVQGGQQPRPQLHPAQARAAHQAGTRKYRSLPASAGHRRPHAAAGPACQDRAHPGQAGQAAPADGPVTPSAAGAAAAARPAAVADRPRRPLDGHQRPRHRHGRLQRADRCRHPPSPESSRTRSPTSGTTGRRSRR